MISNPEGNRGVALKALRDEEKRLLGVLDDLAKQVQPTQAELDDVRGAIASLTGQKKPAKGRRTTGQRQRKEGASRDEVIEHLRAVLGELGSATEDQIKEQVGERVAAAGKSKSGLHITLGRIFTSGDELVRDGDRLKLATTGAN